MEHTAAPYPAWHSHPSVTHVDAAGHVDVEPHFTTPVPHPEGGLHSFFTVIVEQESGVVVEPLEPPFPLAPLVPLVPPVPLEPEEPEEPPPPLFAQSVEHELVVPQANEMVAPLEHSQIPDADESVSLQLGVVSDSDVAKQPYVPPAQSPSQGSLVVHDADQYPSLQSHPPAVHVELPGHVLLLPHDTVPVPPHFDGFAQNLVTITDSQVGVDVLPPVPVLAPEPEPAPVPYAPVPYAPVP